MSERMAVRPDERFDEVAVGRYLQERGYGDGTLAVEQYGTGASNLTYYLRAGGWEGVLRRPPLGPVAPKAHDMQRECAILARLHPFFPMAPRPYFFHGDPGLIGSPFYVMEARHGLVLDRGFPPGFDSSPAMGRRICGALVDTLVALHRVDWQAAGLGEIGHPEGFLRRQVEGWLGRWERAKTAEVPGVAEVRAWLTANLPDSPAPTVIHNDYKLNNLILAANDPGQVVAVVDWEMATVGDPLADVGALLAYWQEPADAAVFGRAMPSVTAQPGFMTRAELLARYAEASGRDVTAMPYYLAFSYFKIAVIVQQIYYRWHQGQTRDERFKGFGALAERLIERAVQVARSGQV